MSVRRRASRRPALSRTAQLEEKLDSLVNLIRANGVAGTARLSSTQELLVRQGGDDVSNARPSSQLVAPVEDGPAHPEQPHHQQGRQQCRVPPTPSASTPEPHPTSPAGLDNHRFDGYDVSISDEEAEEALRNFREQKLCHLPIIMVRPEETAAEFRATKPFLWLSILAVTDRCTSRQVAHGVKFREELARKLFVEQERSPEMLYAVLVYLGW